jgi:hypothetical protein
MKKLFIALLSVSVMLFSCKEDEVVEPTTTITKSVDSTEVFGKTWELVDAKIYTQNLEVDGDNTYYDHFGTNKTVSNLDPFAPTTLGIDVISLGITTWEFNNSGFVLNGSDVYSYSETGEDIYKVNVGGTSRIFDVVSKEDGVIVFKCLESYASIDDENHSFFNYLTFVEKGVSTNWSEPDSPNGYSYGGILNVNNNSSYTLNGTKWVITRVLTGLANEYPNDTLDFSTSTYDWLPSGPGNTITEDYTLNKIIGNNTADLSLYGNPSIGGDYSGSVPENFIQVGVVDGIQFTDMFGVNQNKTVWMVKL